MISFGQTLAVHFEFQPHIAESQRTPISLTHKHSSLSHIHTAQTTSLHPPSFPLSPLSQPPILSPFITSSPLHSLSRSLSYRLKPTVGRLSRVGANSPLVQFGVLGTLGIFPSLSLPLSFLLSPSLSLLSPSLYACASL